MFRKTAYTTVCDSVTAKLELILETNKILYMHGIYFYRTNKCQFVDH